MGSWGKCSVCSQPFMVLLTGAYAVLHCTHAAKRILSSFRSSSAAQSQLLSNLRSALRHKSGACLCLIRCLCVPRQDCLLLPRRTNCKRLHAVRRVIYKYHIALDSVSLAAMNSRQQWQLELYSMHGCCKFQGLLQMQYLCPELLDPENRHHSSIQNSNTLWGLCH